MTNSQIQNCIVVLPYKETSRLFTASVTKDQEAYIGDSGIVYYQSQAKKVTAKEACDLAIKSGNNHAFVRQLSI